MKSFRKKIRGLSGIYFSSLICVVWLIFLYCIGLWITTGTLVSYHFQQELLESKASGNIDFSPADVLMAVNKLGALKDEKNDLEKNIGKSEVFYDEKLNEWEAKKFSAIEAHLKMGHTKKSIHHKLAIEERRLNLEIDEKDPFEKRFNDIYAKEEKEEKKSKLEHMWGEFVEEQNVYNLLEEDLIRNEAFIERLSGKLDQYKEELSIVNQEVRTLYDSSMHEFIVKVDFMTILGFHVVVLMPIELLTMVLSISMGMLGSLIYLTRAFLSKDNGHESFTWYMFRPLLGMVTAVAIYILSKTGLEVFSEATDGFINPYFISFIAIVSGLMSEQAFLKIQEAGQEILKLKQPMKNRWGIALSAEMDRQNKKVTEVTSYLGVDEEVVKKMLKEEIPISEEHQKLWSAYLHQPQRLLFTDLNPNVQVKKDLDSLI